MEVKLINLFSNSQDFVFEEVNHLIDVVQLIFVKLEFVVGNFDSQVGDFADDFGFSLFVDGNSLLDLVDFSLEIAGLVRETVLSVVDIGNADLDVGDLVLNFLNSVLSLVQELLGFDDSVSEILSLDLCLLELVLKFLNKSVELFDFKIVTGEQSVGLVEFSINCVEFSVEVVDSDGQRSNVDIGVIESGICSFKSSQRSGELSL